MRDDENTNEEEKARPTGGGSKKSWRNSIIAFGAFLAVLTAIKHDTADIFGPIVSLFKKEPIILSVTQASAREINIFGGPVSNLSIEFTVDRKGQDDRALSCFGEGYRDNVNMTDAGQHFKSVKMGETDFISIVGAGSQSFTLLLATTTELPTPKRINFRIDCSEEKSPWRPVEVILQPPASDNPFRDSPKQRR